MRVGRGIGSGKGKTAAAARRARRAARACPSRLRGRPDAAPHAAAEARLQQHLRQGLCRGEPGRDPEGVDAGKLDAHATIDHAALKAAGLARGGKDGVRLLGKGRLTAKLSFRVAGVSQGALEAVEKAGGRVRGDRRSSRRPRRPRAKKGKAREARLAAARQS
jgi:large subunit ribosomal protein L15